MIAIVDDKEPGQEVLESVTVVLGDGRERHVKVTSEGIVVDLVEAGEVRSSLCVTHEELLPSPEDWPV